MEKGFGQLMLPVLVLLSTFICYSGQHQLSQAQTLLRIQRLLNFPSVLSSWDSNTEFCNTEPSPSLTVICYEGNITQLHIIGRKGTPPLPQNFSIDSFFNTLAKVPSLKVLTLVSLGLWGPLPGKIARLSSLEILNISSNFFHDAIPQEISFLKNLQTLILDDNMFSGQLPDWLDSLLVLSVFSIEKNSLNGTLPDSLGSLEDLRVLSLSHNHFSGEVPDLSSLSNLQVLDLEDNSLGPQFPQVGSKIVTLSLRKNKFSSGIPKSLNSNYQLQHVDLSFNRFVGPFPPSLLSLPSITYLNIEGNRFTGMLFENMSCNAELEFVDLSTNLLSGELPSCLLSDSNKMVVLYSWNCLASGSRKNQHPLSFCQNEALAVGIMPHHRKQNQKSKVVLALSITGGIMGGILLLAVLFLVSRRINTEITSKKPPTTLITENASTVYTSKFLFDARYITQAMKLGAIGLPAYRNFTLKDLEEATKNFDTSAFIGEGCHGQMYRGQLSDGSFVAICCLKLKRCHSSQSLLKHIEVISKLRHRHLVSVIGHCFECYLNDSSVTRIFLVFEYVPNGTLRDWISERRDRRRLTWAQRIAAAVGVAKGIQFLTTGIVPGIFSNDLKITDILLDQNFVAKISIYNLPLLAENLGQVGTQVSSTGFKENSTSRTKHQEKSDIYDFGLILLEIILGRPASSKNEVNDDIRDQLQACIAADEAARRSFVDPAVCNSYSDEALKTLMGICCRCLFKNPLDRPSIEDVLWNLQFAAQVQDAWRGDSQSSDGSPVSHFRPRDLRLTIQ